MGSVSFLLKNWANVLMRLLNCEDRQKEKSERAYLFTNQTV